MRRPTLPGIVALFGDLLIRRTNGADPAELEARRRALFDRLAQGSEAAEFARQARASVDRHLPPRPFI